MSTISPPLVVPARSGGRLLLCVSSGESWYWKVAVLDPATGTVKVLPVRYDGDLYGLRWAADGSITATGSPLRTELWRFRRKRGGAKPS